MNLVMELLDDGELWKRARAGDTGAFGVLFDRHANSVYRYCFRRTAEWALAEDLTSVVFFEAWRRCADVELGEGRLLPWLLGVATNVIRNQRRSLRRYRAALERLPPLEFERDFAEDLTERLDAERRMRTVLADVRRMPRAEQEVLALCIWEGLSSGAVAEALGVPEGTVRSRLFRARARLREAAARHEDPSPLPSSEGVIPQ
jgi:RNA polymerase sigma factor (sigma-70 family)